MASSTVKFAGRQTDRFRVAHVTALTMLKIIQDRPEVLAAIIAMGKFKWRKAGRQFVGAPGDDVGSQFTNDDFDHMFRVFEERFKDFRPVGQG